MNARRSSSVMRLQSLSARWLTLASAPITISLAAIVLTNATTGAVNPAWLFVATGLAALVSLFLYLAAYTGKLAGAMLTFARKRRSRRYRKPVVLVLDGTVSGDPKEIPPSPLHSDRLPIDWKAALSQEGWQVEVGPVSLLEGLGLPDIVINPFGEVYPESDFSSNPVAALLRKFVWDGGIYVNTAGIPFWYRYDPRTNRRETAGRIEGIFEGKPNWISLFHDIFPNLTPAAEPEVVRCTQTDDEVRRFGDIVQAGGEDTVAMFRAYALKPPVLIPILLDANLTRCIIGSYSFGDGAFLISAVVIDRANKSFEKTVAAIKAWAMYESQGRPA